MVVVTLMWSIAGVVTRHLEAARSFEVTFWRSVFNALALARAADCAARAAALWRDAARGALAAVAVGRVLERDVHRLHGGASR